MAEPAGNEDKLVPYTECRGEKPLMASEPKIVCNNIWKVFGADPQRTMRDMDRSLSRAQIQEQTGHVVAVKDVSFKAMFAVVVGTVDDLQKQFRKDSLVD